MDNSMSDDSTRIATEDAETRFVGIPNAPNPKPTPTTPCPRVLHPDHVAVGSPITRVPLPLPPPPPTLAAPPSSPKMLLHPNPSTPTDPMWAHDLSLSNDFSRMNLFHAPQSRFHSLASYFNETGNLSYHHHVNNVGLGLGLDPCSSRTLSYNHHVNNAGLLDKGHALGTPEDHANYVYHNLVDQRRKQLQGTSDGNYHILRDTYMASHTLREVKGPVRFSQITPQYLNANSPSHYYVAAKEKTELATFVSPRRMGADTATLRCDNSLIIQGKDVKHCFEDEYASYRRSTRDEFGVGGSVSTKNCYSAASSDHKNGDFSLPMQLNFYSVPDAQCYMYNLAKDQNGCRFLQRMVDEGTYQDICMVFEGIIGSVVELMIDSFGNYLVQKLLHACTDYQRLQIVHLLTNQPGQLVRISLNTHGTRVVQKLIETLATGEQVSLVKSAIEPGFLDLIKDLNGNHVIQRCLQCLSCRDNQFIYDAAVKFCVEIATHQHGCCVLQRCIYHSAGKNRDKLVNEICKHGLLLALDPFGNYVVQYVIEMDTPTATAKMLSQFKGNYVNLSTQKFSSHVVEKCLKHVADCRSRIIRELLSAPHFEQVLQDPYANYVIQSALAVTKGPLHAYLSETCRHYKMLRTSPYCKRIFSASLLKK